jgi:hypothetical protein
MSHVTHSKVVLNSLDDIKAAVRRLGGTFNENKKTYKWYGQWVGDTPMPADVTNKAEFLASLGHCDHEFSLPGASYTVGVVARPEGGYKLQWDFYGSGGLQGPMGGASGDKFTQAYSIEAAKRAALYEGYSVGHETLNSDGSVEFEVYVR